MLWQLFDSNSHETAICTDPCRHKIVFPIGVATDDSEFRKAMLHSIDSCEIAARAFETTSKSGFPFCIHSIVAYSILMINI